MRKSSPPKWATHFIKWYCHPSFAQETLGDLEEMYSKWVEEKGSFQAKCLYAWNVLLFIRVYNNRITGDVSTSKTSLTLLHALKLSLRNIRKYKIYNIGNIFGLAVGIAIGMMIFLHINQELSYEKSYPKHERLFRISLNNTWAMSSPPMAREMSGFFSEIEDACRLARFTNDGAVLGNDKNRYITKRVMMADQSAIRMFDLKFILGSPATALTRPNTIVISATTASKLFDDTNPIGQTVDLDGQESGFEITGVMEDLPGNSHLEAEALVSLQTMYKRLPPEWTNNRTWMSMYTYVLLDRRENLAGLRERMPEFQEHFLAPDVLETLNAEGLYFEVMPITDIHLKSDRLHEMTVNSDMIYIYIFGTLAVFIIIIACVNFINIFSTLAFKRVKEVGLRRVMGSSRAQIVWQLLFEACVSAILAAVTGLIICLLLLPYYNDLADLAIQPMELLHPFPMLVLFGSAIGLGLISGLYPAMLVASRKITEAIRANANPKTSISLFRKGLIVFQFGLSLFILTGTVVVNRQMDYIRNKDLGFEKDRIVYTRIYGDLERKLKDSRSEIFSALQTHANVLNASLVSKVMGDPLSIDNFALTEGDSARRYKSANHIWADENFVPSMDIEIGLGRNFEIKQDTAAAYLVNEQMAESLGVGRHEIIGSMIETEYGETGVVVGVINEVNFQSLHKQIEPLVIAYKPSRTFYLLVRIGRGDIGQTLSFVESNLKAWAPGSVVQFSFLDDKLEQLYRAENSLVLMFRLFSLLALAIACVGLLGLAAIEVQRRTKEVGIRRVMGATGRQIVLLLSRQLIVLLIVAIAISVPISYFSAKEWLADYSYRIALESWEFILPCVGLLVLSMLVVFFHSINVIRSNPTESLRSE
jgi:putative ABC transport system permease protein